PGAPGPPGGAGAPARPGLGPAAPAAGGPGVRQRPGPGERPAGVTGGGLPAVAPSARGPAEGLGRAVAARLDVQAGLAAVVRLLGVHLLTALRAGQVEGHAGQHGATVPDVRHTGRACRRCGTSGTIARRSG